MNKIVVSLCALLAACSPAMPMSSDIVTQEADCSFVESRVSVDEHGEVITNRIYAAWFVLDPQTDAARVNAVRCGVIEPSSVCPDGWACENEVPVGDCESADFRLHGGNLYVMCGDDSGHRESARISIY